jgi:glutamine amidotransferase
MWAFRYSSAGETRSLFYTTDVPTLRRLYPKEHILQELSAETRLIVSEPIGDLPGAWQEMPEGSFATIAAGQEEVLPFAPSAP